MAGTCDHGTGVCKCNPGFEGPACERCECADARVAVALVYVALGVIRIASRSGVPELVLPARRVQVHGAPEHRAWRRHAARYRGRWYRASVHQL